MATTKQFVYKDSLGNLTTTPTSETFNLFSYNLITANDGSTFYASTISQEGDGTIWSITNRFPDNTSPTSFAEGSITSSQSGSKQVNIGFANHDPRADYNSDLQADVCRGVITGKYVPKLTVNQSSYPSNTSFPQTMGITYNEFGYGFNNFNFTWNSRPTSPLTAPSPMDGNGGQSITVTSAGANVTGGELTGHNTMGFYFDQTSPTNDRGLAMQILPKTNPAGNHLGTIFFEGTVARSWEADKITIDGSDSSHTLPTFGVAATVTADGTFNYSCEADLSSAFSVDDASVNIKQAGTIATATTTSFTASAALIYNPTTNITSTSDVVASIANLRFADAAISSAFTVDNIAVSINANSSLPAEFTTTTQGNIISDITGDYTWNSLSNNPFVNSGYVKGGYTDDAEYEWDDLLSADGSADATWDTWTYGTWLGDETGWDNWPNGAWSAPHSFAIEFTQTNVQVLKLGGILGASTAFTITENVALREAAVANLTSAFTVSGTASGVIDVAIDMSSTFTTTVSDVDYLENITSDEIETFSCTSSISVIGNVKSDTTAQIDGALGFAVSDTVIFGALSTPPSTFTIDIDGVVKYDTGAAMLASLAQAVIARLNSPADFFNTFFVPQESRTIVIPEEQRQYTINVETRLNNISAETRVHKVEQETRNYKLPYVPITNEFVIPKTRSK